MSEESKLAFPRYAAAKPIDIILEPGDGVYIPPHWWHSKTCLDDSLLITLFSPGHWSYRCSPNLIPRDLTIHSVKSLLQWDKRFRGKRRLRSS